MTTDLVVQAERRSCLAAILGRLLVGEPGPHLAELVHGIDELGELGSDDPGLRADYVRLLLCEVAPFESVFLGDDGHRGGEIAADVAARYRDHKFVHDPTWRVAGADHLGIELLFYARLCTEEASGWRDDRPDRAAEAVADERAFLADHLGRWGRVAARVLELEATSGPYRALGRAVAAFLAEEAERLRPDPEYPGMLPIEPVAAPRRLGPARMAGWLLAPARCGCWLRASSIADAARSIGAPWRPSDTRSRLQSVLEQCADAQELRDVLAALRPALVDELTHIDVRVAESDGDRRSWLRWRSQLAYTIELVDHVSKPSEEADRRSAPVSVTVHGQDGDTRTAMAGELVRALRARDIESAVVVGLDEGRVGDPVRDLVGAGARDVLLVGADITAVAYRDQGSPLDRMSAAGVVAPVVVILGTASEPDGLELDDNDHRPLALAVRAAVLDARSRFAARLARPARLQCPPDPTYTQRAPQR